MAKRKITNYERGRKLEWRARKEMVKMGYATIRSAGSKTPIDLVGIGPQDILLVQVSKPVKSEDDIEAIRSFPCPPNCKKQLWQFIPYKGWQITTIGVQLPDQGMEAQVYEFGTSSSHSELQQGTEERRSPEDPLH